ncbi:hypothetical protein K461DRAFT_252256, partial [Myriangium duriaei CBS 260.36]
MGIIQATDHYIDSKEVQDRLSFCKSRLQQRKAHNPGLCFPNRNFDLHRLTIATRAMYDAHENDKTICLEGTRTALLDLIYDWLEDPTGKRIFWLCGKAGTGKSTIACTLSNKLFAQKHLGASFFFKRGEVDRKDASRFFPTLAYQLARDVPEMYELLSEALETNPLLCEKDLQQQFENLLFKPLLSATANRPDVLSKLIIVIDALDECECEEHILTLLRFLSQLKLRIFVTSRPEYPVRLGFKKVDGELHEDVFLEEVQTTTIRNDLYVYITHQFREIRENDSLLGCHSLDRLPIAWPGDDVVEALVSLTVPLFIFAATVCRYVSGPNPQKRLDMILVPQKRDEALTGIEKIYTSILDQMILNLKEKPERAIMRFRYVVGSIVVLFDPLSIMALSDLLKIPPSDIEEILGHLQSVIHVPSSKVSPVRIFHLSFREFLMNQNKNDKFYIDARQTHRRLGEQCIQRLSERGALHDDLCSAGSPGTKRSDISEERIKISVPDFLAYACQYWGAHITESDPEESLYDNSIVHNFLQTHFLHWLEALSWLDQISSAIIYLDHLQSLVNVSSLFVCECLLAFLKDAQRFIRWNRRGIELSPLQLYSSALYFAPVRSVIRQHFTAGLSNQFILLSTGPRHWSLELQKLIGHLRAVNAVSFSPDGELLASASSDKTVRMWNAQTGEQMQLLKGHKSSVKLVSFSPDGSILVSISSPRAIRLWNVRNGQEIRRHRRRGASVVSFALSPDSKILALAFALASSQGEIRLYDMITGTKMQSLRGDSMKVSAVVFSPIDDTLAFASEDKTVVLWDYETGEFVKQIYGLETGITALRFSPDGKTISMMSAGTVGLWNLETNEQSEILMLGEENIMFTPSGDILAVERNREILVLEIPTGKQMQKLTLPSGESDSMVFSPKGTIIASISQGTMRIWDTSTGEKLQEIDAVYEAHELAFSRDEELIAAASDTAVQLWHARTGTRYFTVTNDSLGDDPETPLKVAFSPNRDIMATVSEDTIRVWDTRSG